MQTGLSNRKKEKKNKPELGQEARGWGSPRGDGAGGKTNRPKKQLKGTKSEGWGAIIQKKANQRRGE